MLYIISDSAIPITTFFTLWRNLLNKIAQFKINNQLSAIQWRSKGGRWRRSARAAKLRLYLEKKGGGVKNNLGGQKIFRGTKNF